MIQVTSEELKKQYEQRRMLRKLKEEVIKPSKEAKEVFRRQPYYMNSGGGEDAKE